MLSRLSRENRQLLGTIAALAGLLWITCIPETFTLDECNYLATVRALKDGSVFVPGTEGLPPSPELSGFDPSNAARAAFQTPVPPTVPPLYAPLALPLSPLGWRGLILLNCVAFAVAGALVFRLTKRYAARSTTPWVALATYGLGGFAWSYAQGMWPHMISVALVLGAFVAADRARTDGTPAAAAAAGALAAVACGIRYPNALFLVTLALVLLAWSKRRWLTTSAYAAGLAVPLGLTSLINHARIGTFNPFTKGRGYLPVTVGANGSFADALKAKALTLWTLLVDYSAHPPFRDPVAAFSLPKSPGSGAFLVVGGLKKALLQSAPWVAIGLVALAWAWSASGARRMSLDAGRREALRSVSVVTFVVIAAFGWSGLDRNDGWCFNPRYLLELVPLLAVAVALVVDGWEIDPRQIVIGGGVGIGLAAVPISLFIPESTLRQRVLMTLPLAVSAALLVAWLLPRARPARSALFAIAVGWSLALHIGDDMVAERGLRDYNGVRRRMVAEHLPETPTAMFASAPEKEALCPLQLDHDLVLVDPGADGAATSRALTTELVADGRRVFLFGSFPRPMLREMVADRAVMVLAKRPIPLAEIVEPSPDARSPKTSSEPE